MTKKVLGWAAMFGAGCIAASVPAAAEPRVFETIAYYDVSGTTAQELREDLNRLGPFDKTGRQFDAVTRWYVNWYYQYQQDEQGCSIVTATSEVRVNIVMPRLKAGTTVPENVRQSFDKFLASLLTHERGHGEFGINVARNIEAGLVKLPQQENCDRMGQTANEYGTRMVKDTVKPETDYDTQTRHGATQGARFP